MKISSITVFIFALTFFGLTACGGDDDTEAVHVPMSFATYNAGLAVSFVDYAEERSSLTGEGVAGLSDDVVCMQEVWLEEHVNKVVADAKGTYPNAYYVLTPEDVSGGEDPACGSEESQTLMDCVDANCSDVDQDQVIACVLSKCNAEYKALSEDCSTCLAANITKTIDEIFATCAGSGGGTLAYDGNNGLLLLSKTALTNTEMLVLPSYLNRRVVLRASIATQEHPQIDVYCTHLTANLTSVTYGGEFESWADEQANQIDQMLAFVEQKSGTETPAVLMGDMNCGKASGDIPAALEENFNKFADDGGFVSPYAEQAAAQCTFCVDNPLVGTDDKDGDSEIIDHVMFKNFSQDLQTVPKRILDGEISFDANGETVASRLSDHYGVSVELP